MMPFPTASDETVVIFRQGSLNWDPLCQEIKLDAHVRQS